MPTRKNGSSSPGSKPTGKGVSVAKSKRQPRTPKPHPEELALELEAAPLNPGYDVRIVSTAVSPGATYWKVLDVRHLTPEENGSRHSLFVDPLDESGARDRDTNLRLVWTWEGRQPDEAAPPKVFDKPDSEPATNLDLYLGQYVSVWIEGDGAPSDRVENVHTKHPDEMAADGQILNSIGHHSFHVTFQRTMKPAESAGGSNGAHAHGGTTVTDVSPVVTAPVVSAPVVTAPGVAFRFAAWPSEYRVITQTFGNDPDYYGQFHLPGHEGIDIQAPEGSRIFVVADGQVSFVQTVDQGPYGIHVRVAHQDGYETTYAHLLRADVVVNQSVTAGQLLGLADHTGNSEGDHLHLTLKHAGESLGDYPNNIIDPSPFLAPLLGEPSDYGVYLSDLIVDGTRFEANHPIAQRWVLRNDGQTTWGNGYQLALTGGNFPDAPTTIGVSSTAPGGAATIEVTLRAPSSAGQYRAEYRLRNQVGLLFGQTVWIAIEVTGAAVADPLAGHGVPAPGSARERLGIDVNAPIDAQSGEISQRIMRPEAIVALGVGWVRLNFVLGPWSSVTDTTLFGGRTWQQAYGEALRILRGAGLRIYALVGHEAVREDALERFRDQITAPRQDGWIDAYAETFVAVARMFHDQIDRFESFNEPDNWRNTGDANWRRNWIHFSWFAVMLQEIHRRVRSDPAISDIKLVSGPVQGLDNNNNGGYRYLAAACEQGSGWFGWGSTAPVPFDGIGYHLYLAQDGGASDGELRAQYTKYMAEMKSLADGLGGIPIYISEIGWQSTNGEQKQRERMQTSLGLLIKEPQVALAIWFCLQDWSEKWGLLPEGDPSSGVRKAAFATLSAFSQGLELAAPELATLPPVALEPVALETVPIIEALTFPPVPADYADALFQRLLSLSDGMLATATDYPGQGVKLAAVLAGLHIILRGYAAALAAGTDGSIATQRALDQVATLLKSIN